MSLVVFSQASPQNESSVAEQNLKVLTEAAWAAGCTVRWVPRDWDGVNPDDVMIGLSGGPAVFVGYFSGWPYYEALCEAALKKGVRLINDLESARRAMEFERFYSLIEDLTPRSVILTEAEDARALGFPLFIKGGIKSRKEQGWRACVAENEDELRQFIQEGAKVARQIAPLRRCPGLRADFPASREYRLFLHGAEVMGGGFYWGGQDPLGELSASEKEAVSALAKETALRVHCPLMAVDVGQLESGDWIVIEVGDLQYSGVTQMSPHAFWRKLLVGLSTSDYPHPSPPEG